MAKTIANVLAGVATLFVRQPNDALAEWSTEQLYAAYTHSVKLSKTAGGNDGSTHLQLIPPTGITFQAFEDGITDDTKEYSFRYFNGPDALRTNFVQFEFRFEDPNSVGWCEVTYVAQQNHLADITWAQEIVEHLGNLCGVGGIAEDGSSFFGWGAPGLIPVDDIVNAINSEGTFSVVDCADWILSRVRVELWEGGTTRYSYIGEVTINNITYTIIPGGDAPALSLSSPFTEVGYTEDGVTMEYAAEQADVVVHEETFPIGSKITSESLSVTCNMAEASLANMNNAMAGAVLSGSKITLGAGVNKTMNLKIEGTNPAGYLRAIHIPLAVAGGTVGMAYKKNEKTIVPVTFKALKGDNPACTIVDNAA